MLDVRFRSLEKWPDSPPLRRLKSQFSMKHGKVIDLLEYELRHLAARDIIIDAGFTRDDIRNDGWPRSGAVAKYHPGVILYFTGRDGKMRMPCGTYAGWQSNFQAIARTLELLRAIDRHGVTTQHQQYLGFAALPAAKYKLQTVEDAAEFLAVQTNGLVPPANIIVGHESYRIAYREVAARLHPDKGGNAHLWNVLQEAKSLLDQHHAQ